MSIKPMTKVCSVAALVLVVFAALGPGKWVPRSGLGWEIDHFVSYFALTLMACLVWPRPLVVGGAFTILAVLLEGLQAFTPDRTPDLLSALLSAGGVLSVTLNADLCIRPPRRLNERMIVMMLQRFRPRWPSRPSHLPACLRLRSRAPLSLATVRVLSNPEIALRTLRRLV